MFEVFHQKELKELRQIRMEIMKLSLLMFQDTNRSWELKQAEKLAALSLELSYEKYNDCD